MAEEGQKAYEAHEAIWKQIWTERGKAADLTDCEWFKLDDDERRAFAAVERTIANDALRRAAEVGYRACAETRHVTLGDKVRAAIRALIKEPGHE